MVVQEQLRLGRCRQHKLATERQHRQEGKGNKAGALPGSAIITWQSATMGPGRCRACAYCRSDSDRVSQ